MKQTLRVMMQTAALGWLTLYPSLGVAQNQDWQSLNSSSQPSERRDAMGQAPMLASIATPPVTPPVVDLSPFARALSVAVVGDSAVEQWYQSTNFAPVWTTDAAAPRREALLNALARVSDHGLPIARYGRDQILAALQTAHSPEALAQLEVRMSRAYLNYARDLTSGVLVPKRIDSTIVREITVKDPQQVLASLVSQDPATVFADLLPKSVQYVQLQRAKFELEHQIALGGWGPQVPKGKISPGAQGPAVITLRDRLVAMGYLQPTPVAYYDDHIQQAVAEFQAAHGLTADRVVGPATLAQLNMDPQDRLKSVLVAMERERWMDIDRSGRMIWVNLPDFTAKILDDGVEVFSTRSVIGREDMDRRTPEFSDKMNHMVVNPSWSVPRSITVKEYLPKMQSDPNASSYLQLIDSKGRVVPRNAVNFNAYSAKTFPFSLRQPPSEKNSLGLVKFMFPNQYNIYLHDTPAKSLFSQDRRAYSHGCIRLAEPFDFAHALLGAQSSDPTGDFARYLSGGKERRVDLAQHVPVHLVYFTAYPDVDGQIVYRPDVYERDQTLWAALADAGVALPLYSQ